MPHILYWQVTTAWSERFSDSQSRPLNTHLGSLYIDPSLSQSAILVPNTNMVYLQLHPFSHFMMIPLGTKPNPP